MFQRKPPTVRLAQDSNVATNVRISPNSMQNHDFRGKGQRAQQRATQRAIQTSTRVINPTKATFRDINPGNPNSSRSFGTTETVEMYPNLSSPPPTAPNFNEFKNLPSQNHQINNMSTNFTSTTLNTIPERAIQAHPFDRETTELGVTNKSFGFTENANDDSLRRAVYQEPSQIKYDWNGRVDTVCPTFLRLLE